MKFRLFALTAAAVLSIGAGAYAQQAGHGHDNANRQEMMTMMDDMMPKASDAPAVKAFKEAHMKMMKDMHIKLTGKTDVDFVRGMIPHHQGAIDMAQVELEHGTDPAMRAMAQKVVEDQQREIVQMKEWLTKNDK